MDWHVPTMYNAWESVLFGKAGYRATLSLYIGRWHISPR